MELIQETTYGSVKVVRNKSYEWAVLDLSDNEIVPFGKYAFIDGFEQGLARVRGKGGLFLPQTLMWVILDDGKVISGKEALENDEFRVQRESKLSKWGIINTQGEEVLPVEYDQVWNFLGKGRRSTRVVKDGVAHEVYFQDLKPEDEQYTTIEDSYAWGYIDNECHYGEYAGTYVQDVMGWSDEMIDEALDGEPDAYWNID